MAPGAPREPRSAGCGSSSTSRPPWVPRAAAAAATFRSGGAYCGPRGAPLPGGFAGGGIGREGAGGDFAAGFSPAVTTVPQAPQVNRWPFAIADTSKVDPHLGHDWWEREGAVVFIGFGMAGEGSDFAAAIAGRGAGEARRATTASRTEREEADSASSRRVTTRTISARTSRQAAHDAAWASKA